MMVIYVIYILRTKVNSITSEYIRKIGNIQLRYHEVETEVGIWKQLTI